MPAGGHIRALASQPKDSLVGKTKCETKIPRRQILHPVCYSFANNMFEPSCTTNGCFLMKELSYVRGTVCSPFLFLFFFIFFFNEIGLLFVKMGGEYKQDTSMRPSSGASSAKRQLSLGSVDTMI